MARKRSYSDEDLAKAIEDSFSWSQVITKLGLKAGGGTYAHLQKLAKERSFSSEHFTGQGWNTGKEFRDFNTNRRPLEAYFEGVPIASTRLKDRLFREGYKDRQCEECGITKWHGEPAPLELDHVDGNNQNNSLDNLRILCCNCHAMTATYCGKNIQGSVVESADTRHSKRRTVMV